MLARPVVLEDVKEAVGAELVHQTVLVLSESEREKKNRYRYDGPGEMPSNAITDSANKLICILSFFLIGTWKAELDRVWKKVQHLLEPNLLESFFSKIPSVEN